MEQQAPQAVPVAPVDAGQALDQMNGAMAATSPGIGVTHDLSVYGLFVQADWIVKAVMIMLLLASIWSWAIIIHKLIRLRTLRSLAKQFEDAFWSGGSLEELYDRVSNRPTDPMASIFVAAMREWRRSAAKGLLSNEALRESLRDRIERVMNTALAVVAPGIAEALFATALGLVAAIPAVLAFNKLNNDITRYGNRLEAFAGEFGAILSR